MEKNVLLNNFRPNGNGFLTLTKQGKRRTVGKKPADKKKKINDKKKKMRGVQVVFF